MRYSSSLENGTFSWCWTCPRLRITYKEVSWSNEGEIDDLRAPAKWKLYFIPCSCRTTARAANSSGPFIASDARALSRDSYEFANTRWLLFIIGLLGSTRRMYWVHTYTDGALEYPMRRKVSEGFSGYQRLYCQEDEDSHCWADIKSKIRRTEDITIRHSQRRDVRRRKWHFPSLPSPGCAQTIVCWLWRRSLIPIIIIWGRKSWRQGWFSMCTWWHVSKTMSIGTMAYLSRDRPVLKAVRLIINSPMTACSSISAYCYAIRQINRL